VEARDRQTDGRTDGQDQHMMAPPSRYHSKHFHHTASIRRLTDSAGSMHMTCRSGQERETSPDVHR